MRARIFVAALAAMLLAAQPALAEEGVITLDLGFATDDELAGAMDAATELELIMRADWELLYEADGEPEGPEPHAEEPAPAEETYYEPELAEAEDPALLAEEPVPAEEAYYAPEIAEAEDQALLAEEPAPAEEAYYAPEMAEAEDPELLAEEPAPAEEAYYEPALAEAEDPALLAEEPVPAEETYYAPELAEAEDPALLAEEPAPAEEAYYPPELAEAEDPALLAEEPAPAEEAYYAPELAEAEDPALLAEEPVPAEEAYCAPEIAEAEIPESLLENEHFLESRRLVALAEEAYERGDYEAAAIYAREASRQAQLSDQLIAQIGAAPAQEPAAEGYPLPAAFIVRTWAGYRDCLWNIAARPEIYGNPLLWPELFSANRHRMPNPNNPHLILPGMVLEIPSIEGETREGVWQAGREYRR